MGTDRLMATFATAPLQIPLADDVVLEDYAQSQTYHGRMAVRAMLSTYFGGGFSDGRIYLHTILSDEMIEMLAFTFCGLHDGIFFGIPATNRQVAVPMALVCQVAEGCIHYIAWYYDAGTLLRQLRLV
jgi:hypothetical protein